MSPHLCATTSILAGEVAARARTASTELNKGLRFAKATAGVHLKFSSMVKNLDKLCFVAFSSGLQLARWLHPGGGTARKPKFVSGLRLEASRQDAWRHIAFFNLPEFALHTLPAKARTRNPVSEAAWIARRRKSVKRCLKLNDAQVAGG